VFMCCKLVFLCPVFQGLLRSTDANVTIQNGRGRVIQAILIDWWRLTFAGSECADGDDTQM
jgi:hypothetical protein